MSEVLKTLSGEEKECKLSETTLQYIMRENGGSMKVCVLSLLFPLLLAFPFSYLHCMKGGILEKKPKKYCGLSQDWALWKF